MTKRQLALAKAHGTPEEFRAALLKAAWKGSITTEEMVDGALKYQNEWDAAGTAQDFKSKLAKMGLDDRQIEAVMSMRMRKSDCYGDAVDRTLRLMDARAGAALYTTAHVNQLFDIVLALIGDGP